MKISNIFILTFLLFTSFVSADITLKDMLFVPTQETIHSNVIVLSRQRAGSGTVIKVTEDKTYILTVYHAVIRKELNGDGSPAYYQVDNLRIITFDKQRENADVISYDADKDLAIIVVNKKLDLTPILIAKEMPKQGDKVWHVGNPDGLNFFLSNGIISLIQQEGTEEDAVYASVHSFKGGSGGMILNTKNEIIGVLSRGRYAVIERRQLSLTGLNIITHTDDLNKFLNKIEILK